MRGETVFLGCGFAAKYLKGGGNFSVPLQWANGLRRLGRDYVWLEWMPASPKEGEAADQAKIRAFARRMRDFGHAGRWCLLYQNPSAGAHDFGAVRCYGMNRAEIEARLAGPNTLLNLSYSLHAPFLDRFERRVYCDLDPGEIGYWMTKMEMGQSYHHEFWTIGLNTGASDCKRPCVPGMVWKTFPPLVDVGLVKAAPRPSRDRFTTIGQWYWDGSIEVDGGYPDLSKRAFFQPYIPLPQRLPGVTMEMAMNLGRENPELAMLEANGWNVVDPHGVAGTPHLYYRYLRGSAGEFTTTKGVDTLWKTGWVSDRAIAFLSSGRPVITEDTGAAAYLPRESGFLYYHGIDQAAERVREAVRDWPRLSKAARQCAEEVFDAPLGLKKILG